MSAYHFHDWKDVLAGDADGTPRTFAYFLAEDVPAMLPELADFAAKTGRRVELFVDWFVRRAPRGVGGWMKNGKFWAKWRRRGIDFRLDAGSEEFVRSIAAAAAVVSNSYHALMFSLVFGQEVRIVLPTHPVRRKMNARLREFEGTLTEGPLVAEKLSDALRSLASGEHVAIRTEALAAHVAASDRWLKAALAKILGSSGMTVGQFVPHKFIRPLCLLAYSAFCRATGFLSTSRTA